MSTLNQVNEPRLQNAKNAAFAPARSHNPTIQPGKLPSVLCVRRDIGALVMATPLSMQLSNGNIFPYPGSPKDSRQKIEDYLTLINTGVSAKAQRGDVDIGKMSRSDLLEFAEDEYGLTELRDNKKLSLFDIRKAVMAAHSASVIANGLPAGLQRGMTGIGVE